VRFVSSSSSFLPFPQYCDDFFFIAFLCWIPPLRSEHRTATRQTTTQHDKLQHDTTRQKQHQSYPIIIASFAVIVGAGAGAAFGVVDCVTVDVAFRRACCGGGSPVGDVDVAVAVVVAVVDVGAYSAVQGGTVVVAAAVVAAAAAVANTRRVAAADSSTDVAVDVVAAAVAWDRVLPGTHRSGPALRQPWPRTRTSAGASCAGASREPVPE